MKQASQIDFNKTSAGDRFEAHAQRFLEDKGFTLLQAQFDIQIAEIDLIMSQPEQKLLIFVEVRARRSKNFGGALVSISPQKCRKIIQAADFFLQQYPQFSAYEARFDVITFEAGKLQWHPNAFDAEGV
jgi:putative endonuclease